MADTEVTTTLGKDEVDGIYETVMTCKPAVGQSDAEELEQWFNEKDTGVTRRCGFALAAKDGAFFKQVAEEREMAETMVEVIGSLDQHIKILEEALNILKAGFTRSLVALCNQDGFDPASLTLAPPHQA